jgi:hypothetical protein
MGKECKVTTEQAQEIRELRRKNAELEKTIAMRQRLSLR